MFEHQKKLEADLLAQNQDVDHQLAKKQEEANKYQEEADNLE